MADAAQKAQRTQKVLATSTVHFLAGGTAGCLAKSVVAPLDRVKILFQTNNAHYPYTGVFSTIRRVAQSEGTRDLWKGNSATLIRVFPYAAIQWASYEQYKKLFLEDKRSNEPHTLLHALCGSLAGATATSFTYPLDLLRARLASEVRTRRYRNVFHGFSVMYRQEGPGSLFRGMQPTLQGIVPYAGVNFGAYETFKFYSPKNESGEVAPLTKLLLGGLAGAVGQTVSYPWDVIRRRMQTMGFAPGTPQVNYTGSLSTMKHIIEAEGWRALYKGISINFLKVCPSVAIAFTSYEWIKASLQSLEI